MATDIGSLESGLDGHGLGLKIGLEGLCKHGETPRQLGALTFSTVDSVAKHHYSLAYSSLDTITDPFGADDQLSLSSIRSSLHSISHSLARVTFSLAIVSFGQ
jgi:hypothetical protein